MIITSVTYRELQSGPGFSNRAVEATAQVSDSESPDDALGALQNWVGMKLRGAADIDQLLERRDKLLEDVNFLEARLPTLQAEVRRHEGLQDALVAFCTPTAHADHDALAKRLREKAAPFIDEQIPF